MNEILNLAKTLNSLSESEKSRILNEQSKKRLYEKRDINSLTNAEILEIDEFKKFCVENNIEPTKRQAGKKRGDFINWLNAKK